MRYSWLTDVGHHRLSRAHQDVFEEMDDLYDTVLANIQLVVGSAALTEESQDVQLVYEAYSYVSPTQPPSLPATSGGHPVCSSVLVSIAMPLPSAASMPSLRPLSFAALICHLPCANPPSGHRLHQQSTMTNLPSPPI